MAALTGQSSMVRLSARTPAFRTERPQRCMPSCRTAAMGSHHGAADLSSSSVGRSAFVKVELPSSSVFTANRIVTTFASKVTAKIKLELIGGKANPAPPVGPALGSKGVNIMAFCKQYNAETQKMAGEVIPVEITVYEDRSFTFILKTPPAAVLLKKAAGITKGAGKPNTDTVGQVTMAQVKEIAAKKLPDTNTHKLESAMRMIQGTAKNMGIKVVE